MDASLLAVLTESERLLVAETDRDALIMLDEDGALRGGPRRGEPAGRGPGQGVGGGAAVRTARRGEGRQAERLAGIRRDGAPPAAPGPRCDAGTYRRARTAQPRHRERACWHARPGRSPPGEAGQQTRGSALGPVTLDSNG